VLTAIQATDPLSLMKKNDAALKGSLVAGATVCLRATKPYRL
jgi:hypothetical protein